MMNVPKLRFKGFSENWTESTLNKHFNTISTNSYSRSLLNYENGSVRNIHYGDIHVKFKSHFHLKNELVPFINEDVFIRYGEESYCQKGDLIFADASEDLNDIGKSIEIIDTNNEKILAGLHTIHLRPISKVFADGFGGYLLKSENLIRQIQRESQGAKVLGISATKILNLNYNAPTLPEQEKIASFFTAVDSRLEKLKKKKELLETYKKGVMQKIFSQELRFKDEKGNNFPDWEEKKLGDLCTTFSGGTPKSTNKEYYNGHIPFIKSGEISNSKTEQFISEEALNNSSAKLVEQGDLLYALYGATSGNLAISKISGAINQAVLCIRSEKVNIKFLLFFLQISKQGIISNYLQGGQGNLSAEIIKNLKTPNPSLPEQQKIAEFLTALDKKIDLVNQQISKTELWKKGLLQQMFV